MAGPKQAGLGDWGACPRRAVGADRFAAAAEAPLLALSRMPADRRSRRTGRDRVRAQDRDHLETAAHRPDRLLGDDLLAAAAGLDRSRRVAGATRAAAGRAARRRRAGPGPLRSRWLAHSGAERGDHVGPSPVDRGRPGCKQHLIVDAGGVPLAVTLTGGNRNDVT